MKKTNKIITCLSALSICFSALSVADISNVLADYHYGYTDEEIASWKRNTKITIDKVNLTYEEAKQIIESGGTAPVSISIEGAEEEYSYTAIHVNSYASDYGTELSVALTKSGYPKVTTGDAIIDLVSNTRPNGTSGVCLYTSAPLDNGHDGVMYTIEYELPENIQGGETFPIKIEYQSSPDGEDYFTNVVNSSAGKELQAWIFSQGIENGYIHIEEPNIDYKNWRMFEDTIVSIEDNKVIFDKRGKTDVVDNGANMEMLKNAGAGSKVSVEAIVSPSGTLLNILNIEILENSEKSGDANGDGEINSADAVFIMQALSNPDEYQLTEEGKANADVVNRGDGVTAMDALAIQLIGLNLVKAEDFPITTEDLEKLMK